MLNLNSADSIDIAFDAALDSRLMQLVSMAKNGVDKKKIAAELCRLEEEYPIGQYAKCLADLLSQILSVYTDDKDSYNSLYRIALVHRWHFGSSALPDRDRFNQGGMEDSLLDGLLALSPCPVDTLFKWMESITIDEYTLERFLDKHAIVDRDNKIIKVNKITRLRTGWPK